MRHQNSGRRLGVDSAQRCALMRNLVTDLMRHGRIQTTEARAKELRRVADRIITLSRRITPAQIEALSGEEKAAALVRRVHAIRLARKMIEDREVLQKVFGEYSSRYATRPGGYTRILKLGTRPGDQAKVVLIELVVDEAPAADSAPVADSAPEAVESAPAADEAAAG